MSEQQPVTPRPAATLVMLRDGRQGLEVCMLRRSTRSSFVGGAHVFPGGAVDAGDARPDVIRLCEDHTDTTASRRLGIESGGLAYWVAAIRECFEEAGVLMARDRQGNLLDATDPQLGQRLQEYRRGLMAGEGDIVDVCRNEALRLATGELYYYSHWITPQGLPRRYDTRFFIAVAPPGQDPEACRQETFDQCWVRPANALDSHSRGDIDLVYPTMLTLQELADHDSSESVLRMMRKREQAGSMKPRVKHHFGGTRVLLPGEPGYED